MAVPSYVSVAYLMRGDECGLAANDLWGTNACGGVTRVDDELGLLDDFAVVVIRVIGDDGDTIVLAELVQRNRPHVQVVFPSFADRCEVRIVVTDLCAPRLKSLDD